MDNEVVKNAKFNTLKTKVNSLEKKIPNATTSIDINQYNTDKQNFKKKLEMLIKEYQIRVVYVLQLFLTQKLVKVRTKYLIMINILLLLNLIS